MLLLDSSDSDSEWIFFDDNIYYTDPHIVDVRDVSCPAVSQVRQCTGCSLLVYNYIHTFIHSYIHTFIHSYIHTFIHSYIRCVALWREICTCIMTPNTVKPINTSKQHI